MWCRSEYILCVRCVWKKSAKSKWERWAITLTLTHTRTLVTAKRNQWLDSRVLPSILKYSCQRYIRIWRHTETGLTCILMVLEIFFPELAGFDIPNSIWPRVILSSTCSSLFVFEMFNFIMCIFNFTRSNHRIPQCTHLSVSEGSTDDAQYFDKQITNEYSIYIYPFVVDRVCHADCESAHGSETNGEKVEITTACGWIWIINNFIVWNQFEMSWLMRMVRCTFHLYSPMRRNIFG